MNRVMVLILILMGSVAVVLVGCQATRAGYESAPYQVVRSEGKFEVRDYPALKVVETSMVRTGSNNDEDGGSFNRLFGFITGRNAAQEKIAMTTPVFMSVNDSNRTMAFVLPAQMASGQVPAPTDESVTLREVPPGRFVVKRFRGGRSEKRETEALASLRHWMESQGLEATSQPVYGYFDPPWTPAFLRRNEVMLRTETKAGVAR